MYWNGSCPPSLEPSAMGVLVLVKVGPIEA